MGLGDIFSRLISTNKNSAARQAPVKSQPVKASRPPMKKKANTPPAKNNKKVQQQNRQGKSGSRGKPQGPNKKGDKRGIHAYLRYFQV